MIAGTEQKDIAGESLCIEGCDIDELNAGRGRFNDNHSSSFYGSLGRVTEAKKIFSLEDCEHERHEYYWNKVKGPFLYCKGYLHSDEDHPNARAAAAILRNIHRDDCPLKLKASVEGGVLARGITDQTRLARTKIHSVALTFTPCNVATLVEPLNIDKTRNNWKEDKQLIKSVAHLAETNVPSFRHITRHASANTIYENIHKIKDLAKSIGLDIEIKGETNPQEIINKAVLNKVATNVNKINELIKAIGGTPVRQAADAARTGRDSARDQFQQKVGQLKAQSATPSKPKDTIPGGENMQTQNAGKVKAANEIKRHASRAMKDKSYLDNLHSQLKTHAPDRADHVINTIKDHMQKDEGDVEKGVGNAIRTAAAVGALTVAAGHKAPYKPVSEENKPKEEKVVSRKPASEDKDQYWTGLKDKAEDRAQRVKDKYSKAKTNLKKALTAGYGGAGSPTDLTGGGGIQPESLDRQVKRVTEKNEDEFEYVTCDECGHEQVYMKHQVKCRKCKKNFQLEKLGKYI